MAGCSGRLDRARNAIFPTRKAKEVALDEIAGVGWEVSATRSMKRILIVHAHHEPQSFSSALARRFAEVMEEEGHEVAWSDLYAMGFDPVSSRKNFTTVADAEYFKQQAEETYASQHGGFSPDLDAEMAKVESADLMVFSFPLWWFAMPAILKGWVDRVFAYGRIYGNGQLYENGIGAAKAKALVLMTTGGPAGMYDGWGLNPSMGSLLQPIHHGVFWFNGFLPLDPFISWAPAHVSQEERDSQVDQLAERARGVFEEPVIELPTLEDFPHWGSDRQCRFMVEMTRNCPADDHFLSLVPAELERVENLKRSGRILEFYAAESHGDDFRGYLLLRAPDRATVEQELSDLPLADYLDFRITKLGPL